MNALFGFMASQNGRYARIGAGALLIIIGLLTGGTAGWVLAIVGLAPLLAGIFDVCLFAPLFSLPFKGDDLRDSTK